LLLKTTWGLAGIKADAADMQIFELTASSTKFGWSEDLQQAFQSVRAPDTGQTAVRRSFSASRWQRRECADQIASLKSGA